MLCTRPYLTFFTLLLPTIVTAQCPSCDSYTAALKSCQTTSANITAVGDTMDTTSVQCMCVTKSDSATMNTCVGCWESNAEAQSFSNEGFDVKVLQAWGTTCKADAQFGEQQAVSCWESQPSILLPCFEKSGGTTSGPTLGNSGTMPSASSLTGR